MKKNIIEIPITSQRWVYPDLRVFSLLRAISGLFVAFTLFSSPGLAQDGAPDPPQKIIATINRQIFTVRDLDLFVLETRLARGDDLALPDQQLREAALTRMIDDFLLTSWADFHLEEPEEETIQGEVASYMDRLHEYAGGEIRFLDRIEEAGFTDSEVRRYVRSKVISDILIRQALVNYTNLSSDLNQEYKLENASRILLAQIVLTYKPGDPNSKQDVQKKALAIRRDIEAGITFEEAALMYSEDPYTAQTAGILGWLKQGQLAEGIWKRALETPFGEISEPYEAQNRYHLFKVIDFETPALLEFREKVKEQENIQIKKLRAENDIRVSDGYELRSIKTDESKVNGP